MAAALRPGSGDPAAAPHTAATPAAAGSLTPEGTAGTAAGTATPGTGGENGGVEAALNQSANQNLYFIEVQERISAESRSYSAISNVLKARQGRTVIWSTNRSDVAGQFDREVVIRHHRIAEQKRYEREAPEEAPAREAASA